MTTKSAYRAARPTIVIGGQDNSTLAGGLLTMMIEENIKGLYRCEAVFGNWGTAGNKVDFLYFDRQTLDFGKQLKIMLGNDSLFEGRITGIEGMFPYNTPPKIRIFAEDRFQDLRMTRRTRTFADMSDADILQKIASDHGLSPQINVSGPSYKVVAQVNQSDLAFLRERARSIDAEVWVEAGRLMADSRKNRGKNSVEMRYGSGLKEFSVLADLAGQRTSLTISGWDVAGKSGLQHEANDSSIGSELDGKLSGASILSVALGDRKEVIVHTVPLNSQETQTQSEAFFRMTARRFLVGRGKAQADSRLRVGALVDLKELGPLFSGKYYLTEVCHLFDGISGMHTDFTAERPGLGRV